MKVNKQYSSLKKYMFFWVSNDETKFLSLTSFIPISLPARTQSNEGKQLDQCLLKHEEHPAGLTLALSVKPKLFLRWKCFESTGFSDNKNERSTDCAEGPFWNLVQSSKPNRGWKWECHEENERVSCCLQCSTAGYWHSHIKRNKHFSPNLGHKRRK